MELPINKTYICILCGAHSGDQMVCSSCKEAFIYYKTRYFTEKVINETTKYDNQVFEEFCKEMALDELLEDNISGLFPTSCEDSIKEVLPYIRKIGESNKWFAKQEGRIDAFEVYVKDHIRKYYDEHSKKE